MKKMLIGGCLVAIIACNNASESNTTATDTTAAKPDSASSAGEWITLFDGNSTSGWHTYGNTTVGSAWKVDSGTLHFVPTKNKKDGGDIVTNDSYENFHLKLEWKVAPKGNSGIIFLVNEDTSQYKNTYNTGPEMQVLDNSGHPDAKINKHRAGDLYDLISSSQEVVKPAGEWNLAEVIVNNARLDLVLNGTTVVSTTLWDDNWNKMIAGSKFKDMPGFAKSRSGKIALQDHGDEVWYRNITIKKL
jgi:hypothetical protein